VTNVPVPGDGSGLVIHHGSVGCWDGLRVDGTHRWAATGGVPIRFLFDASWAIDGPGRIARTDALVHLRPSPQGALILDVDDELGSERSDLRSA
jgi:hypothetical protein